MVPDVMMIDVEFMKKKKIYITAAKEEKVEVTKLNIRKR